MCRFLFLIIFLINSSFAYAQKKKKNLSPFQAKIEDCFKGQIDVHSLNNNKKLYLEIVKNYTLQASETRFREVEFKQNGDRRKLRFEDGVVQIFKLDAEDNVILLSTDDLNIENKSGGMRYKLNSLEAKISQHLNRAEIKSDFTKTTEYRSRQLVLNLVWSDNNIKNLVVQYANEKNKLECQSKDLVDICDCHP